MGGRGTKLLASRKPYRLRLSSLPKWNKGQRAWLRQVERTQQLVRELKASKPLHGAKWKSKMLAHYCRLLAAMLPKAPKGCEETRDELAKLLGVELD